MAKPISMVTQVLMTGFWLLVILAIAFFVLYLIKYKQPIPILSKAAGVLGSAAQGKELD